MLHALLQITGFVKLDGACLAVSMPRVSLFVHAMLGLPLLGLLVLVSTLETAVRAVRDWDGSVEASLPVALIRQLRHVAANPLAVVRRMLLLSALLNIVLAVLAVSAAGGALRAMGWSPYPTAMGLLALLWLAGVVLPKMLARRASLPMLIRALRVLNALGPLLDPLSAVADRFSEAVLRRLLPKRLQSRLPMTREELETLVEMRQKQAGVDALALGVIAESLEMERLMARDCMVPRVDLTLLASFEEDARARRLLEQSAGRFVVVHGETPDEVLGVVDVQAWRLAGRADWRPMLSAVPFVPETMPMTEVMERHLLQSAQPVMLVDEFGGFEGLLSVHELADWLLSDCAPWGRESGEVRELAPGRYLVEGGARLEDVEVLLDITLPNRGVDSIGGWVFTELGHVPKAGERLHLHGVDFKVRRVVKARILELEMRKKSTTSQPTAG